jgi:hypothetical protein
MLIEHLKAIWSLTKIFLGHAENDKVTAHLSNIIIFLFSDDWSSKLFLVVIVVGFRENVDDAVVVSDGRFGEELCLPAALSMSSLKFA